ncbi:MAG: RNA 2',3'-cyclic phosphodiesterase [Pseudomonadota bacterium]
MSSDGTARLFLALLPPAAVRAALADHVSACRWPAGATVYAPADWHLTLHFIGAVPHDRLPALRAGLALSLTPFTLHLGEPAAWPHGLAVLLPRSLPPALRALHDALGSRLRGLGLCTDARPYHPHLTLARRAVQAQFGAAPACDWPVRSYVLMESTGQPEARYRVLQEYGGPDFVGIGSA